MVLGLFCKMHLFGRDNSKSNLCKARERRINPIEVAESLSRIDLIVRLSESEDGGHALMYAAVKADDHHVIMYLLSEGVLPDQHDNVTMESVLFIPCTKNTDDAAETVKILLQGGANINWQSRHGYTPLAHAIKHKSLSTCWMLLCMGADATCVDINKMTPKVDALGLQDEDKHELALSGDNSPNSRLDASECVPRDSNLLDNLSSQADSTSWSAGWAQNHDPWVEKTDMWDEHLLWLQANSENAQDWLPEKKW
jgi:hypothetical protein